MTAGQILGQLRGRYSVPQDYAERFLPLVRRALRSRPEVRARILKLVEGSFSREAGRLAQLQSAGDVDLRVLQRVASVLESWEPPDWLLAWGEPGRPAPPTA